MRGATAAAAAAEIFQMGLALPGRLCVNSLSAITGGSPFELRSHDRRRSKIEPERASDRVDGSCRRSIRCNPSGARSMPVTGRIDECK